MSIPTAESYSGLGKQQTVFSILLFVLLVIRFPVADFVSNFAQLLGVSSMPTLTENLRLVQFWTHYLFEKWSFVLVGIVIVLNQSKLKDLNIDIYFLAIFMISGVAYTLYYPLPLGWVAVFISIYLFILISKQGHKVSNTKPSIWQMVLILAIGLFLVLLIVNGTKPSQAIHWSIVRMPFVILEEVIFRGLLWWFLKFLGWTELKIVILQAILFWFFHTYYMFAFPAFFWVVIPIVSLFLGITVWCYKSITPSTIAHLLFNFSLWFIPL